MDNRLRVALVLVSLAALAIIFRPNPPELAYRSPETVRGTGTTASRPFPLFGDYVVDWEATSDVACYYGATLRDAEGRWIQAFTSEMLDEAGRGQSDIRGIPSGEYHVEVSSGCGWVFRFLPVTP